MYFVFVILLLPSSFMTVNVTVNVPAAVYWCAGFWSLEVPPSSKVHAHEVGELVDVSVNVTVSGLIPEVVLEVKLAT